LFVLADIASCAPLDDAELLAALFEFAALDAELTFDAELLDALVLRERLAVVGSVVAVPLLELLPVALLVVKAALATNETFAAALWLAAAFFELFAAALLAAPLFFVEPCPCWKFDAALWLAAVLLELLADCELTAPDALTAPFAFRESFVVAAFDELVL
jgi:hypothetical protein